MLWTLIGIAFFLLCILIAFRIGITRHKNDEEELSSPMIHASGIYSIVRKSPRQNIANFKPSTEKIRQYLAGQNVDINGKELTAEDKEKLLSQWTEVLDENISEIEKGDSEGVEFYYYDFPNDDPVTGEHIKKGHFVTREEIHTFPQIIPPLHIGCRCRIKAHHGIEKIKDTTEMGLRPLFHDENLPPMPRWKDILKTA